MRLISNEKGVTMMSLVVTVIIMIILTVVSLNGAFGEGSNNSLVERAKNARYKADVEDLKDFWEAKLVDVDTTHLNYDSLEDVMDEEQIPENLRGVFAVKQGKLVYKDDYVDDAKKEILKEFEIYSTYVDPIEISIKAKIKKITAAKSADVIAVIDASGSMNTRRSPTRFENVCVALNSLMTTVLEADPNNRIAMVQFDSEYQTLLSLNHYTKALSDKYISSYTNGSWGYVTGGGGKFASSLNPSKIADYVIGGGTYIQVGVARAEKMFQSRTEEEKKNKKDFIVLLSDGEPGSASTNITFDSIKNGSVDFSKNAKSIGTNVSGDMAKIYETVRLIDEIKKNHDGELKIYTINYGGASSTKSQATMNPTKANVNAISTSGTSTTYKNKLLDLIDPEKTSDTTKHNVYPDKAYSGEFSTEELNEIFSEIGQDIIKKDETVFDMDTAERVGDVIIENKMQFYDDNGKLVDYVLDEAEGDVTINVNASVFVPTGKKDSSGNIIRAADTSRTKTHTKSYTIEQIKAGADPNLKYENGNIVWNIESDFDKDSTNNIKAEAINLLSSQVRYDSSIGEEMGIKNVEIILPLVTYEE